MRHNVSSLSPINLSVKILLFGTLILPVTSRTEMFVANYKLGMYTCMALHMSFGGLIFLICLEKLLFTIFTEAFFLLNIFHSEYDVIYYRICDRLKALKGALFRSTLLTRLQTRVCGFSCPETLQTRVGT